MIQLTFSYAALEAMALGKRVTADVGELDVQVSVGLTAAAMEQLWSQMVTARLLRAPTPELPQ